MSLNDPNWGRGGGNRGPGGGNQGPPDLDELWRNFNRRLADLFGRKGAGDGGGRMPEPPSARALGGGASVIVGLVLAEIRADGIAQLAVWNKIDVSGLRPAVERDEYGRISRILVSARTGAGLAGLRGAIAEAAQPGKAAAPTQHPSPELSI